VATYRWQLTASQGFDTAAAAVPDLAALGVSHLYLSPVAEAVPGSTHGYDVTDPTRLREELGGPAAFTRLGAACRAAGLRLLVDIVPNHLAAHDANAWWWDVLRLGAASRYGQVFDVDWSSLDALLLPVLGDHYGRELEAGNLVLERGDAPGRLAVVRYHQRSFPLRPEAEGAVFAEVAREADDDVLGVAARLLARAEAPAANPQEREADLAVAERAVQSRLADPRIRALLDIELAGITADADRLDLLLSRQHFRLARWTVGDAELDYRRFFDVDSLAATRMDGPVTFDLLHQLSAELLADPVVDGLRVDHVDGLADPSGYLDALRSLAGPDAWLVVEKIVRREEDLPPWPVDGTTGYEVAELLGGWLTDPAGAVVLQHGWAARTGEERSYRQVVDEARREVLAARFAADLRRVVDALQAVCVSRRRHRDHSRSALREAVIEVAVHTPRYRTYVTPSTSVDVPASISDDDRAVIAGSVAAAKETARQVDPELLELLSDVLTGSYTGDAEAQVITRFQQLTGPLAAKGEEDTALYRWLPLPHRCEVGCDPSIATTSVESWHQAAVAAQERWPERLTTLSTHDTKRSADARARLAALTTVPAEVLAAFDRWWEALAQERGGVDAGTGWLVFHALLAGWPMDAARAWTVVEKSAREAGVRTSWTRPDANAEADLRSLVEAATADVVARRVLVALLEATADAADVAALAQLLAQLLAPGVPDLYQGAEAWDRSLVDPDNRRPPDPCVRAALVAEAGTTDAASAWRDPALRQRGLPRTIVLRRTLAVRRRHAAAVGPGDAGAYLAIPAGGREAERVLAYARGGTPQVVVVVARPNGRGPADAEVVLPAGVWTDVFTGVVHHGTVDVGRLLADFPVSLLER
jgi:(1->4)-alpha-D-glucan 1-alpha-D-glucosylmutase